MSKSYICNTSNDAIGRSAFSLKAKKCPNFQLGDIVYLSNLERVVHSRLEVTEINERLVTVSKNPETSVSITQEEILSKTYNEKYSILDESDADKLEKCFIHDIKIFPYYDYRSENQETNMVLNCLKQQDLKVEVYPEEIRNNDDLVNRCLNVPTSVIIVDGFGVLTIKCVDEDLFSGDIESIERLRNQLKNNDIEDMLISSPQLTDEDQNLIINHLDVIVFETANEAQMNQLNNRLDQKGRHVRVFNCEQLIGFIKDKSCKDAVIDDKQRIGIVQSLLPKYINSKTIDITREPIDFTPDDTFELDDIQKDVLAHLNERTNIKASAGSGKTILLLAKAYEVAKANPERQFLLLCYNNELSKDIQNQANNTGRNISNLKISTFDMFLMDLGIAPQEKKIENFAIRKKTFVQQVMSKKINLSYGGIFVDEVQQMRQEWLDALLECTDDEKYMIVSGDHYQSINPSLIEDEEDDDDFVEEGDNADYIIGGNKFRTMVLDKNYRNTKSIAKVLKNMVSQMNDMNEELGVPAKKEKVIGHAYKESVMEPYYIKVDNKPQKKIDCIVKQVDKMIDEYDCAPSDILLICPRYDKWMFYLEQELQKKYEVYNFASISSRRGNKSGIKIGTIGKSIGLDFKAVILYDTSALKHMFGDSKTSECLKDIDTMKTQRITTRKKFMSFLRNIYVACSRARSILVVLDDEKNENLFTKFIEESGMEEK